MKFRKNVLLPVAISSTAIFAPQAYALDREVEREMKDVGQEVEQTYDEVAENSGESWDKTKYKTKQQWQDSKKATKDTWNETKEATANTWEKVKDSSKKAMDSSEKMFKDGMIAGSLETALVLNKHVNPFEIDIEVENGDVVLSGEVDSEIDRELAVNIAKGVDGVNNVTSHIKLKSESTDKGRHADSRKSSEHKEKGREFSQYISDVTTTASIKTELLANDSISGLDINVDTHKDQVTLSGKVESAAQKSLAEAIAKKRDDVSKVVNKLTIRS